MKYMTWENCELADQHRTTATTSVLQSFEKDQFLLPIEFLSSS